MGVLRVALVILESRGFKQDFWMPAYAGMTTKRLV
jgi:hypothetical protein